MIREGAASSHVRKYCSKVDTPSNTQSVMVITDTHHGLL